MLGGMAGIPPIWTFDAKSRPCPQGIALHDWHIPWHSHVDVYEYQLTPRRSVGMSVCVWLSVCLRLSVSVYVSLPEHIETQSLHSACLRLSRTCIDMYACTDVYFIIITTS